jgi:hypothetical protein
MFLNSDLDHAYLSNSECGQSATLDHTRPFSYQSTNISSDKSIFVFPTIQAINQYLFLTDTHAL